MWDEITYPFPNVNGAAVEVWEWISNFHSTLYWTYDYLSILEFKSIHVISKMGSRDGLTETDKGMDKYRTAVEVILWMSIYITYKIWDSITYPCPSLS